MSVYGASFIREVGESGRVFAETVRVIRERNARWLAASPENLTIDHTVRSHPGTSWISIENALDNEALEQISRAATTEAITVYAIDEMVLRFRYVHLMNGRVVRALEYGPEQELKADARWLRAEGEPESWESLLYSPEAMQAYQAHGPRDEVAALEASPAIVVGATIPWACEAALVRDLGRLLQLPWDPWQRSFPEARQHEVIEGSTDRWKSFHKQRARPWWKLW